MYDAMLCAAAATKCANVTLQAIVLMNTRCNGKHLGMWGCNDWMEISLHATATQAGNGIAGSKSLPKETRHRRQHIQLQGGKGRPPESSHRRPPQLQEYKCKVSLESCTKELRQTCHIRHASAEYHRHKQLHTRIDTRKQSNRHSKVQSLTKADPQASVELHPAQKLDDVEEDACPAVDPGQIDEELAQVHDVGAVHPASLLDQPCAQLVRHHRDCITKGFVRIHLLGHLALINRVLPDHISLVSKPIMSGLLTISAGYFQHPGYTCLYKQAWQNANVRCQMFWPKCTDSVSLVGDNKTQHLQNRCHAACHSGADH